MSEADWRWRFTVPPDKDGTPLLTFLGARFPYFATDGWRERLARGRLLVNGTPTEPGHRLRAGELLEYLDADLPEPPVSTAYECLFRDEWLMVINKPATLPCHPGGRYHRQTLVSLLRREDPRLANPLLVNRLDRETSGLVLVALTREAAKRLQRQFMRREVKKRYSVLVEGRFPAQARAEGWIVPDPASVVRKRRQFLPDTPDAPTAGHPDGERAVTGFRLRRTDGEISEIEAWPETGRLHQIRATLHALGCPVVGDKLYGPDPACFLRFCDNTLSADDRRRLRMERQALHAEWLQFRHPADGHLVEFAAPLPADMAAVVEGRRSEIGGRRSEV